MLDTKIISCVVEKKTFFNATLTFKPILLFCRTQLQLLASACLLLASKLHDPRPMSLLNLVVFTDCSISVPELQSMEMLVLEKLR